MHYYEDNDGRIAHFVAEYNKRQAYRWDQTLQYQMHRLKEDMERLEVMHEALVVIYESERRLQSDTKKFIDTDRLNNADVNRAFFNMKREQFGKLQKMGSFRELHENELTLFKTHMEDFDQAYKVKETTLVSLRKNATLELIGMYRVYALIRAFYPRNVLDAIFQVYTEAVFSGVVLITHHMVKVALSTVRTQGARK